MSGYPLRDRQASPRRLRRTDEIIMNLIETVGGKDIEKSEGLIGLIADRMARVAGNEDGGARRYGPLHAIDRHDGGAIENKINFWLSVRMQRQRSVGLDDGNAGDEAI